MISQIFRCGVGILCKFQQSLELYRCFISFRAIVISSFDKCYEYVVLLSAINLNSLNWYFDSISSICCGSRTLNNSIREDRARDLHVFVSKVGIMQFSLFLCSLFTQQYPSIERTPMPPSCAACRPQPPYQRCSENNLSSLHFGTYSFLNPWSHCKIAFNI